MTRDVLRRAASVAVLAAGLLPATTACTGASAAAPRCSATERVALIAQSVPSSTYVPCLAELPPGWSSGQLQTYKGHSTFTLRSDRSAGHPVHVRVAASCDVAAATPIAPRTPGGRTYLKLRKIDPRYTGTLYDVFPGGCVSYRFDFSRDAHIALMAQLQQAVAFVSRQQLRQTLHHRFGVRLDP